MLFAPNAREMYAHDASTSITVDGVSEPLEGESRGPGHFRGVATVVAKLFNIVQPTVAYFGQKDAQQALVIRRMVRDLDFPVRIEVCPTVREPDGLAMSSRNVRLSRRTRERRRWRSDAVSTPPSRPSPAASAMPRAVGGARPRRRWKRSASSRSTSPSSRPIHSAPMRSLSGEILIAVAASVGGVRLIDNEIVGAPQ